MTPTPRGYDVGITLVYNTCIFLKNSYFPLLGMDLTNLAQGNDNLCRSTNIVEFKDPQGRNSCVTAWPFVI